MQRDGIKFAATRYVSPVLAAHVGEHVTVRYSPRDVGEIRVYFIDAYLCRAIAPELAADAVSLKEMQAAAAPTPQPRRLPARRYPLCPIGTREYGTGTNRRTPATTPIAPL